MQESIVFTGTVGEVVHMRQDNGKVFEQYRRSPGTRLIIVSPEGKVLLTKEKRQETNSIDLRLPGGKVCDTIDQYRELRASGQDMVAIAKVAAQKEALEETGLHIQNLALVTRARAGATVEWDLYYFLVRDYGVTEQGQKLEEGEDIQVTWLSVAEIKLAIASNQMQEWRSVGVLLGLVLPKLETGALAN
ncbi:MAG: NUDIX domain-containing protein [Candidatus Abawacabacteria bacterium]|nr:NUDIX domain-containing protein [Candidatus Abawacabacteria bacterium]